MIVRLINAERNGLRPSIIPGENGENGENHFPKAGVCGILPDRKPGNFTE
jgi:hypothetical protein